MALATSTIAALGAAAVAAGASAYNTNRVAKKQDQEIARGIREKSKVQRRADAKIADELTNLERSTSADEQQTTMGQYQNALRGTDRQAQAGQALTGLSKEYDAATGAAQGRTNDYLSQVINSLSRIDAAGLQRQGEGMRMADLGTNLSVLGREAGGIDFLSNMRAQGVRRNAAIDAFAAGLNAYAGGASGAAGGAKTTADPYGGTYRTTGTGAGWRNAYGGGG